MVYAMVGCTLVVFLCVGFIATLGWICQWAGKENIELQREWWAKGVEYGRESRATEPVVARSRPPLFAPGNQWTPLPGADTVPEAIEVLRSKGFRIDSVTEYPKAGITFASVLNAKTATMDRVALRTFRGVFTFSFESPFVERYEAMLQKGESS